MILVLTTESGDFSHIKFIDWLTYYKANYIVITGERILRGEDNLTILDNEIFFNDLNLTKKVSCVFYRRWLTSSELQISTDKLLNDSLNRNLIAEMYEIRDFLYTNLKNAVWFPNADSINVNKLSVLEEAKKILLDVPDYIVTNKKEDLVNFYIKHNKDIITKSIGNFLKCYSDDGDLISAIYTKVINDEMINVTLPEGLQTSYKKQIVFQQEMSGTADIITEDLRLIERLLYQFKDIFKR